MNKVLNFINNLTDAFFVGFMYMLFIVIPVGLFIGFGYMIFLVCREHLPAILSFIAFVILVGVYRGRE